MLQKQIFLMIEIHMCIFGMNMCHASKEEIKVKSQETCCSAQKSNCFNKTSHMVQRNDTRFLNNCLDTGQINKKKHCLSPVNRK